MEVLLEKPRPWRMDEGLLIAAVLDSTTVVAHATSTAGATRPLQYMCGPDKKYPARDKKMATDLSGKRSVQVIDRHRDSNLQIEVGVFPGCAFSTTGKGAMRTVPRRLLRRRPFQRYLTCLGLRKVENASLSHRVPSYCRVELSRGYFFPLACEN